MNAECIRWACHITKCDIKNGFKVDYSYTCKQRKKQRWKYQSWCLFVDWEFEIHFCVAVMCLSFVCDYDYIMPAYCLADACLYDENMYRFFLIVLQQSPM